MAVYRAALLCPLLASLAALASTTTRPIVAGRFTASPTANQAMKALAALAAMPAPQAWLLSFDNRR